MGLLPVKEIKEIKEIKEMIDTQTIYSLCRRENYQLVEYTVAYGPNSFRSDDMECLKELFRAHNNILLRLQR